MIRCERCGLCAAARTELLLRGADDPDNGRTPQPEPTRDLAVRQALRDEREHLHLTAGEVAHGRSLDRTMDPRQAEGSLDLPEQDVELAFRDLGLDEQQAGLRLLGLACPPQRLCRSPPAPE